MKPNDSLKHEREIRGWSQARLAEEIGTTTTNIGRWERGISMPSPYFREKLCAIFGKEVQALGLLPGDEKNAIFNASESILASYKSTLTTEIFDPTIPVPKRETQDLFGRQDILQQLKQTICTDGYGAARALHGLPGVGKTTLAVALVYDAEVRAHFRDGILWAGLGPAPNLLQHLSRWGTLLGITFKDAKPPTSPEIWAMAIRTAIGSRRMLIVIDDAWEFETALACRIGGPHCSHIVTTRCPQLAISLVRDGAIKVPELNEEESVALLEFLAPAAIKLDSDAAHHLSLVTGGLPLALTLLGKYLQVQAYSGQPRRLQNALEQVQTIEYRLNIGEPQIITEYHPNLPAGATVSLQSVIAVSDHLLDGSAHQALLALSVFPPKPNSFSEEAALITCATSTATLDTLYDIGLLECCGPGRYTLHQTIVDYARINRNDTNKSIMAQKRLIIYMVDYVKQQNKNYEALERETENIVIALEAAYTQGWHAEFIEGVCASTPFFSLLGLYTFLEVQLQRACEVATTLGDQHGLSCILYHRGENKRKQGNYIQAEAYYQEGLTLAQHIQNREHISLLLRGLGVVAEKQGNYVRAESAYLKGLALARQIYFYEHMSLLLSDLGMLLEIQGMYMQAEGYLQEALTLARVLGLSESISVIHTSLSWIALEQGNYAQAEAYLQKGLAVARRIAHFERMSSLLANLGMIAMKGGDLTRAEVYLQEGLALTRGKNSHMYHCTLLLQWGELSLALQRNETASAAFREALTSLPEWNQEMCAQAYYGLARALAAEGDFNAARKWGQKSLTTFETLGHYQTSQVAQWMSILPLPTAS